jgi:methanogenic corrinoid protein MtbC1
MVLASCIELSSWSLLPPAALDWQKALRAAGYPEGALPIVLNDLDEQFADVQSLSQAKIISGALRWVIENHDKTLARLVRETPQLVYPAGEAGTVQELVDSLVNGNGSDVERIVALHLETSDFAVMSEELIVPTMGEIDRRWQEGLITAAHAQRAGRVLELGLAQAAPAQAHPTSRGRALLVNGGGDPHQLGLQILGDSLTDDGWDVEWARPSVRDISGLSARRAPDVLVVSLTLAARSGATLRQIKQWRAGRETRDIPILAGGRLFRMVPSLADELGVDLSAHTASEGQTALRSL